MHTSDDATFEDFVRTHSTSLLRTAYLLSGSHHGAEDLLQDTLAHLYPRWPKVMTADAPLAYVRRTLTNRYISSQRRASSRDLPLWELPDGWDGHDLAEDVATQRAVWQLLGDLPAKQRAAVVLRYFHDLADAEIAEVLECRAVTVRSLLSRAIRSMRRTAGPAALFVASEPTR